MKKVLSIILILLTLVPLTKIQAEDGYDLWLRYKKISDKQLLANYRSSIKEVYLPNSDSPTIQIIKKELKIGLEGLLDKRINFTDKIDQNGTVLFVNIDNSDITLPKAINSKTQNLQEDGFLIEHTSLNNKQVILVVSKCDIGLLYGAFHFLKLIQTHHSLKEVSILENPKVEHRLLNHWDNLNRIVERGYAGFSIWQWHKLPGYVSPRYTDYARANASIGINGTVLTNVNADAFVLIPRYLKKVAAIADVLRPYGIKVYLTARFSAPMELDSLETADPLNEDVRKWWQEKVDEIYKYIPDFGGFLVKANSEGQPGPQDYNRSHAEGANMLAEALEEHGGIVMWRAFVYKSEESEDRAKQAYNEFTPLDGEFRDNVLVQVKNGPIDFQPREPFHPIFGAMPKTPLMMEFQITQEYLGLATHLVYLLKQYKECLQSDTYAKGKGSTVAKIIDGSLYQKNTSGMAGVSNIGTDRNWTGHPFAQANWYGFGRLAWDPYLSADEIAEEWLRMTFTNDRSFVKPVKKMMLSSREAAVNYMTPIGLHHIMGTGHHYGPGPWVSNLSRPEWNPVYYHQADKESLGFDRTTSGSNAVSQYHETVKEKFNNIDRCPEKLLLWFHHVDWDYEMDSGRTLWKELCYKYYKGVEMVRDVQATWQKMRTKIDKQRYEHVKSLLEIQEKEAIMWRNACVLYFQQFSEKPIPDHYKKPDKSLEYYKNLDFRYAPGNLRCE
ncbi:MAG: alpha-glucuronidase [Candidatus Marinimicrobia bacterium]|nr:alpha-glucuronidase [Candidatus Neomarinimicrobiota bacterium]